MKRLTFNLNQFLEEFGECLVNNPENIDDEVQRYNTFLSHTKEPLLFDVMKYVNNHPLVTGNQKVRSYINVCHKRFF